MKIWCEGQVALVANGTTTTEKPESAKCKKLAKAGAVRTGGRQIPHERSQRPLHGTSYRMPTSHHARIHTWRGASRPASSRVVRRLQRRPSRHTSAASRLSENLMKVACTVLRCALVSESLHGTSVLVCAHTTHGHALCSDRIDF